MLNKTERDAIRERFADATPGPKSDMEQALDDLDTLWKALEEAREPFGMTTYEAQPGNVMVWSGAEADEWQVEAPNLAACLKVLEER